MTVTNHSGDTLRPWVRHTPGRRLYGVFWLTDEEALAKLEAGEPWRPADGEEALVAEISRELYRCDGSGVRLTADDRIDGLCLSCGGLGCDD